MASKPMQAGRAAEAGMLVAQAAQAGMTGSRELIDGESGIGCAWSNGPGWCQAVDTLGYEFHITRITFKDAMWTSERCH